MSIEAVVVGLGNPGPRYAFTRHNAGFILLDVLAQEYGAKFKLDKKIAAEKLEITLGGKKTLLLKPQTFMNLSGESVAALYREQSYLRELPLVVVHDEADISLGKIKIKTGGSDAGQNGLKSIREKIGHGEFTRLRLGIGKPGPESRIPLGDYVLQTFSKADEDLFIRVLQQASKTLEVFLSGGLLKAQDAASFDLLK